MTEPSVPKFGSFRPAKSTSTLNAPQAKESSTKDKVEKKQRTSSEKREDSRRRHHKRHRSQTPEKPPVQVLKDELSRTKDVHELADVFVVDRRGDEKNLVYGGIHKYSVPPFRRFGAGYVLGLSSDYKIDRNLGDDKAVAISKWRDSRINTREKYVFAKVAKERPRFLKIRPALERNETALDNEDFVPLSRSHGKKRKRLESGGVANGNSSESEQDERDYRSIHGMKKSKDFLSDDELQFATESDSSGSDAGHTLRIDLTIQSRSIELSKRVDQKPNDIENWLALIDHQDVLLQSNADRRRITNAETRSTAEIKMHMYEKALEKMTTLPDRERLLLGLMAEGVKIWDLKAQSARWEQISNDNIDSLLLWTSYLNFKQSNFTSFRYEEIKELYLRRIKLLTSAITKAKSASLQALFTQIIYVSLRLTLFIHESGYSELAIAIWQGILEITFFRPSESITREGTLESFKEFWESEVPRLGEEGAVGWRKFSDDENSSSVPDAVVDEEADSLNDSHIFGSWACAERLRSKCSLPARTMDEVVEDDPFRVILFSDIEDYVVLIPPESEELRKLCLNAFLLFCRMPLIAGWTIQSPDWSLDSYIRNEFLEIDLQWSEQDPSEEVEDDEKEDRVQSMLSHHFHQFQESPVTNFGTSKWFRSQSWRDLYSTGNEPVPYMFIRNSLKQLTHASMMEEVAEYHLAFENLNETETIKKTAKAVLKRFPSSLPLYNAYAMIEWSRNKDTAKAVFSAALSMNPKSENATNNGSILLWKSWIWCCINDEDHASALGLLLSILDEKPNPTAVSSPALLLKTKQHLTSSRDFLLSSGSVDNAVMYAECLALLEYLTASSNTEPRSSNQGDIAIALQSYTNFSHTLRTHSTNNSQAHQLLLQSASHLLLHHSRLGPYRPSLLRHHFSEYITLFPKSTIFLSLFAWNERHFRVEHRVRNILSSTILRPTCDNPISRLFAINHEISSGTIHSAKAAFEHALASPACKGSAGIWRFYILYSLSILQFRAKAKEIWYRALRACPWAKELYVLGFEKFGRETEEPEMGYKEMRSAWRVMGEKELRVRVDLEDNFEEIGEVDERQKGIGAVKELATRQRLGFK